MHTIIVNNILLFLYYQLLPINMHKKIFYSPDELFSFLYKSGFEIKANFE
jgi:hypothetical protein